MQRQVPEGRPGLGVGVEDPVEGLLGTQREGMAFGGSGGRGGVTQRLKAGRVEVSPAVRMLAMCAWVEGDHCGRPA